MKEDLIKQICGGIICLKFIRSKEACNIILDDVETSLKQLRKIIREE